MQIDPCWRKLIFVAQFDVILVVISKRRIPLVIGNPHQN